MIETSKASHKQLRELAEIAYERELNLRLDELADKFDQWRKKEISSAELNDLLHNFHQGTSKSLYGIYNYLDPDGIVARALAYGILSENEVSPELRGLIKNMITFYKEHDMD